MDCAEREESTLGGDQTKRLKQATDAAFVRHFVKGYSQNWPLENCPRHFCAAEWRRTLLDQTLDRIAARFRLSPANAKGSVALIDGGVFAKNLAGADEA